MLAVLGNKKSVIKSPQGSKRRIIKRNYYLIPCSYFQENQSIVGFTCIFVSSVDVYLYFAY